MANCKFVPIFCIFLSVVRMLPCAIKKNGRKVAEIGLRCPWGADEMFRSEIHEHSFGTSLYIDRYIGYGVASQRVRHSRSTDTALNLTVLKGGVDLKRELFNRLPC